MHTCLTYFLVGTKQSTNFDAAAFCAALNICTNDVEFRDNGGIRIGKNTNYNVDTNEMVYTTLASLWDKRTLLVELKNKYNLTYYLERVPQIDVNSENPNPLLSLNADIIAFLHETGTIDDLDYYVF